MKGKKKKTVHPLGLPAPSKHSKKAARRSTRLAAKQKVDRTAKPSQMERAAKAERRAAKLERRLREKRLAESWDMPAPSHLVGRLERSKVLSKYHSYFEFTENTERKDKKLEFQITDDARPPPGFKFVPIGDPTLTNACKELSRARGAMIFIVSASREENLRVKDHVFRLGYHFRESIVDEASEIVGETAVTNRVYNPNEVEPIPQSQEEINKQADGAIRDLFPRIPNTDRQMVIDHAFQKGTLFHGEPTVGLQPGIPLSRRVQLAVLAHIRHTHTRYDLLLRETTWMNARKVVEPVCLDVLVKWRGDEETGRDQMEEILREVVVITDSEGSDDSSEEEDISEEEEEDEEDGEVTSTSSASVSLPDSRNQHRSTQPQSQAAAAFPQVQGTANASMDKRSQRGFKRYQAAWDDALTRQQAASRVPEAGLAPYGSAQDHGRYYESSHNSAQQETYYAQPWPGQATNHHRDEVMVRPLADRQAYHQSIPRHPASSYASREERPPVVVRASPTSNGLQDSLVPSIETASSEALFKSRPDERREVYGGQQLLYPPPYDERRRQSPAPRQVIVINDDSPQLKRRRMVYEDNPGRFRPVASRDQDLYSAAPRVESHLSSVQPREFLVRREMLPPQPSNGMSKVVQPPLTGGVGGERPPIYNSPLDSGHNTSLPDRYGRVEVGHSSIRHQGLPMGRQMDPPQPFLESRGDGSSTYRPVNGDMRVVEHDRIRQLQPEFSSRHSLQRPSSPAFPVSRLPRPHESSPEPVEYQTFVDNFSQARLDPPLLRARDERNVVRERSHHNSVARAINSQRYEDRPADSFTILRSAEARSPVRYVEGPTRIQREPAPIYYGNGQPAPERYHIVDRPPPIRGRSPPEGDSPQYIRTVRRPFVEID